MRRTAASAINRDTILSEENVSSVRNGMPCNLARDVNSISSVKKDNDLKKSCLHETNFAVTIVEYTKKAISLFDTATVD